MAVTATQSSTAKAPVSPKKRAGEGGSSRFYARNGDVFMVSEGGGYFLSRADEQRMMNLWRQTTGDTITDGIRQNLADELEAAIASAERQLTRDIAA